MQMITVWEVYRLDGGDDFAPSNEHVRYYPYRKLSEALEHWKNVGGFSAGYGLRLALAKTDWLKQEERGCKL